MSDVIFKTTYGLAILLEMVIRTPYNHQWRKATISLNRVNTLERLLLGLLFVGMFFLPMLYIVTPWLAVANYTLPEWAGWVGVVLATIALWLFWRAHVDLGRNWSPSLQIFERHTLVTNGIYQFIRHPMYASQWMLGIAQIFLLQNWIAGWCGFLLFLPLYFTRVPQEERMMQEQFGTVYTDYMARAGRIWPKMKF